MLVCTNTAEIKFLTYILTHGNVILHLYSNNYAPTATSTISSFVESTWDGYEARTIATTDWATPTTDVDGKATSTAPVQTWTCTADGGTVYGYWVEDSADNSLLWAERFTSARTIAVNDELSFTPKLTLDTEV